MREGPSIGSSLAFGQRAVRFPLPTRTPRLANAVLAVARALAEGAHNEAVRIIDTLATMPAAEAGATDAAVDARGRTELVAPTLRAHAAAHVLLDLARGDWQVAIEGSQILVTAPTWRSSGSGLSPLEISAEKQRIRQSLVARIEEQLERPATRVFIQEQERIHFTGSGPRMIVNLFADGPALASSLRERGVDAIRPYLQAADGEAGRDTHTGLRLCDIFRYFRYYWSFPFGSTPGRTVPFLVRDEGQPSHPVVGLIALASAVPRLGARDTALGWTAAWLEAVVAALDPPEGHAREHFEDVEEALRAVYAVAVMPGELAKDLSHLLGMNEEMVSLAHLGLALDREDPTVARGRLRRAQSRLVRNLLRELETSLGDISLDGLGITHAEALLAPVAARRRLELRAGRSRARWHASRSVERPGLPSSDRPSAEDLLSPVALRQLAKSPLFLKKRIAQAAKLLTAWEDLEPVRQEGFAGLRLLTFGRDDPWRGSKFTGGTEVSRGLRSSLLQRQGRLLATQIADVVVCGAIPPYGPLLGGKLTALLALSREPAAEYHRRYAHQASEIASQVAGRPIIRSADLIALTTTSFYGVGSSQYERARLPSGVGWRDVGYSAGHGTLHFSRETTQLLQTLVRAETGRSLNTSTFGEGPSERLRKLREGLARLGLDEGALLQHGMPRRVYLAELVPGQTHVGARPGGRPWRIDGPKAEDVAKFWGERWLGPRLARSTAHIEEVAAFRREAALLSARLIGAGTSAGMALRGAE